MKKYENNIFVLFVNLFSCKSFVIIDFEVVALRNSSKIVFWDFFIFYGGCDARVHGPYHDLDLGAAHDVFRLWLSSEKR